MSTKGLIVAGIAGLFAVMLSTGAAATAAEVPTGACCQSDGTCVEVTQGECNDGGAYQGDGTVCAQTICVTGACCLNEYECMVLTEYACEYWYEGLYQDDGTDCSIPPCNRGACCVGGSCFQTSELRCAQLEGDWQGEQSFCGSGPLCAETGACCFSKGCQIVDEFTCGEFLLGFYQGDDTLCEDSCAFGACCIKDSFCFETFEDDCGYQGGDWAGEGTFCPGGQSCDYEGACCVLGSCLIRTADECASEGGDYLGDFTTCPESGFCPPGGGCCVKGDCVQSTEDDCLEIGGEWLGDDTLCGETVFCPVGACCFGGECVDLTQYDCENDLGEWLGEGTNCQQTGLCARTGACCVQSECIDDLTELDCVEGENGEWAGEGTFCEDSPCTPTGACCVIGQCFEDLTEADCLEIMNGDYLGDDTNCSAQPGFVCPPAGACCIDGDCIAQTEVGCGDLGGFYQGDFTSCDNEEVCIPPSGACCFDDASCNEVTFDDCDELDGSWQGAGSSCSDVDCESQINFDPPVRFVPDGAPIIEERADFNLDSFLDVAVVSPMGENTPGEVQVFYNLGNGVGWNGFGPPSAPIQVGIEPRGIAVGLIDEDAYPDIAVTNAGDDTISVIINDGAGGFLPPLTFGFPDGNGGSELDVPFGIAIADFTGDGRSDIALTNVGSGDLLLLVGADALAVPSFTVQQRTQIGEDPTTLDPEDLDNDKDIDLGGPSNGGFGSPGGSGRVSIFENMTNDGNNPGGDVFAPAVPIGVGAQPVDLTICDIDGNGTPDIVTANRGDGTLTVVFNDGNGGYVPGLTLNVGTAPLSIDAGDFDGDGDNDLTTAANDQGVGPSVQVLENQIGQDGLPFGLPIPFIVDGTPKWLVTGDVNNDLLADIISVNEENGGGSVSVLLNESDLPCPADVNGDGTVDFTDALAVLASGPCPAEGACPADVNGDGEVDLLDVIAVLANLGPCQLTCTGDIDEDGSVGLTDLQVILSSFGACDDGVECVADLNNDGTVNVSDLVILLVNWGPCND